jgi:hypothetical protein
MSSIKNALVKFMDFVVELELEEEVEVSVS